MSWALNYLVKSAMEKQAKWLQKLVARLQQLPPQRRSAVYRQLGFTNESLKNPNAHRPWQVTPKQLHQAVQARMGESKRITPGGFKNEMFVPTGEPSVISKNLPQDPRNLLYRANRGNAVFRNAPVFGTGYPTTAEHYATNPAGTLVFQMKTPAGAKYSPHVMLPGSKRRDAYLRKHKLRPEDHALWWDDRKSTAYHEQLRPWGEADASGLPFYEALTTLNHPSQILKAWKTTGGIGSPMTPVKFKGMPERELQSRVRQADWWESPIMPVKKPALAKRPPAPLVGPGPRWMTGIAGA